MHSYILALDQGTTSSRAILFDKKGSIVTMAQKNSPRYSLNPDGLNTMPMDMVKPGECCDESHKYGSDQGDQIKAIGITNQRETTVVWDRQTGHPIYHAIVWQDHEHQNDVTHKRRGYLSKIQSKTGLVIDAYFSATKVEWIIKNVIVHKS